MLDLDAIRARLAAITPGPRQVRIEEWEAQAYVDLPNGDVITFDTDCAPDDAEFDAAAPADMAALLAEVERLRVENHWLHSIVAVTRGYKAEAGDYPPTESWRGMTLHVTDPKPPAED